MSGCPSGYIQVSNQCLQCSSKCQICSNSNTCTQCLQDYYLTPSNTCVADCNLINSNITFFYPNSGRCHACTSAISGCLACTSNSSGVTCNVCQVNTYLHNNQCDPTCPTSYYPSSNPNICTSCPVDCLTCNSTTCLSCTNGKVLY